MSAYYFDLLPPEMISLFALSLPPTPLHTPAQAGNAEVAGLLLAAGADPNLWWGQDQYLPLHLAVERNDVAMVELLLDHGSNIDQCWGCDGYSTNPLTHARLYRQQGIVDLLLERGADPEVRPESGPL
ncbi:ankyrin repeat-containing domain protein [Mycena latifolia]|nr:ankyrin repeat-containing domain protein [Mycena latifolia]